MSSFSNALDEIDHFRKSFVGVESIIFHNTPGSNQKAKKRPPSRSSIAVSEKQDQRRSTSFMKQSLHLRSVPLANELPSDVPIPNSVVRNNSIDSFRRESSISKQRRLSKDDIKALIKVAVMEQMNKENETPKQSDTNLKQPMKTSGNETRRMSKLKMDRKLSLRRSSEFDKRKSILRSVRRTSEEQAPEIRPSLLEEIRRAIQMETSQENERKLVIADEKLEKSEEVVAKDSKKSDTIASSNAWLENITERLSLSSKRVSELSDKIAATRKSSMLSVDSDDSITWSQRMSEMDTPSKSKQNASDRFKSIDAKLSKQSRSRQFGSGSRACKSANVSRDSKCRLIRVGSPSVLSDKSSFTYRSDDCSAFARARKTRSADKERRSSFSNIKVGPAMTRHLEQERSSTKIKGSPSNLSTNRSDSAEKIRDSSRSGSKLVRRSKTGLQNASMERLGNRSRSNCSVGDARFNPERRSLTKRASLTDLIGLYYSTPTRRSTLEGLKSYQESISKKDSNGGGGRVVKNAGGGSVTSIIAKTPKTPQSLKNGNDEDSWYTPDTPTRSSVSLQGRLEDCKTADEHDTDNELVDENVAKPIIVKSIMKSVNDDRSNTRREENSGEDEGEEKKKSEKGGRRLSLIGAETLVVPSDAQEEKGEKKRRRSSQRKSSLKLSVPKTVRKKSGDKGVANKKESKVGQESNLRKLERREFDKSLEEIDKSVKGLKRLVNVDEKNDDTATEKCLKEPKNIAPKQKAHHDCKLSGELDSKLLNVNKQIRNNNYRTENNKKRSFDSELMNVNVEIRNKIRPKIKAHKQEEDTNDNHTLDFKNISLLRISKADKTNRVSVDKDKNSVKNRSSSVIDSRTEKILKRAIH
ncbi:uncharacterized protein LOC111049017 [Nilaparvata lugens]|uniref:uncharacterized protein LOC111049017 n=1 Tax=Nilaparvata lugens TaxID=108931 RepID=UPI00193E9CCE|nr:uncharacterized protein LOC111049017 [Nilaparvata lugens]